MRARVRGATLRTKYQDSRLQRWLETMDLDETNVAPGPKTRTAVTVYFTHLERARARSLGSLFGLGIGQIARVLILHGLEANNERLESAKALGYDIG